MNKFEQEVEEIIEREQRYDTILSAISALHDKEMIEFAEWVSREGWVYATIAKAWVNRYDDDISATSPELLTIFHNQQK